MSARLATTIAALLALPLGSALVAPSGTALAGSDTDTATVAAGEEEPGEDEPGELDCDEEEEGGDVDEEEPELCGPMAPGEFKALQEDRKSVV